MTRALFLILLGFAALASFPAEANEEPDAALVEAAREYFDTDLEQVYGSRKHFVQALDALHETKGIDALEDLAFLRHLVQQGRAFQPAFSDKAWRNENSVTLFDRVGPYTSVASERMRFAYVQPKTYPSDRDLAKIPRPGPFPLLMAFHEAEDAPSGEEETSASPGRAVLTRRYPQATFPALYTDWLMLAPVVPQARWLESNGALRHRYSTYLLHRFWQHFHVDFEHIVLDGKSEAAALAAVYPLVFSGVVLRGGTVDPATVKNFASVPVFVAGDAKLEKALEEAGHPDVTTGDDVALATWLEQRKRVVPAGFAWEVRHPDHVFANWIQLLGADVPPSGASEGSNPTLSVRRIDTEDEPNTLRIDTRGVEQISFWLNDDIVDLDRDVRLVLNGEVQELGRLERSFARLFDKDPKIRKNMFFGWLFPTFVGPFAMPAPRGIPMDESTPVEEVVASEDAERAADMQGGAPLDEPVLLSAAERLELQHAFLTGRPDVIEKWLRPVPERARGISPEGLRLACMAEALYPLALRDLWWRTTTDPDVRALYERSAEQARRLTARRLAWILGGGAGAYPEAQADEHDGWPVLTSLILDRLRRESKGRAGLPEQSPLATRPPPEAWKDWWSNYQENYLDFWMRQSYDGNYDELLDAETLKERADVDRLAQAVRNRNAIVAAMAVLAFVIGVVGFGGWVTRRSRP